jgi:hypothetical protein
MHEAAVHTETYKTKLKDLQDQLGYLRAQQSLGAVTGVYDKETQAKIVGVQSNIDTLQGQYRIQSMNDQYAQERETLSEQMRLMFADWIKRTTDLRSVITTTFDQSLSTINGAIVKTMVDPYHRGDWKVAGKSIFSSIAGTGLTAGEGALMKAMGLGSHKPRGTPDDPVSTRDVGMNIGAGGAKVMTSLLHASSAATTGAGSAVGKILGTLVGSIPFMAAGGPLGTGMPAIVGENGPELFIPSGSGRIVPNDALARGTSHVWNIDARGSNDPAAVRFAVQRGILEAAPRIAAGSIAASRDMAARKPVMSR